MGIFSFQTVAVSEAQHREECAQCPYNCPLEQLEGRGLMYYRAYVHLLLDNPSWSRWSRVLSSYVLVLILLSTICFCVQSLPQVQENPAWWGIEAFVCLNFTVEFALRFWAARSHVRFLASFMNLVDLCAFLPFYIELLSLAFSDVQAVQVLRTVRLVRLFRLFKMGRYSSVMQTVGVAISRSADAFVLLVFMFGMAVVITGGLMYYCERGTQDERDGLWYRVNANGDRERSPFQSIPAAFYWAMITMTTVGYGDVVPTSGLGRFIAGIIAILGVLVIGLPVGILGAQFLKTYQDHTEELELPKDMEDLKEAGQDMIKHREGLDEAFKKMSAYLKRVHKEDARALLAVSQSTLNDTLHKVLEVVLKMEAPPEAHASSRVDPSKPMLPTDIIKREDDVLVV